MDWALAIKRNREALERIVAALFSLVGLREDGISGEAAFTSRPELAEGGEVELSITLPRHLHAHVRRILRAAEAAIRRLVVIAAREITVTLPASGGEGAKPDLAFLHKAKQAAGRGGQRPGSSPVLSLSKDGGGVAPRVLPSASPRTGSGDGGGGMAQPYPSTIRIPAFPLLDPLKRYCFKPRWRGPKPFPRIWVLGMPDPAPIPRKPVLRPDDPVDTTGLRRRLLSARRALANLPREARRLARWNARNKLRQSQGQRTGRSWSLRIGHPPGWRKRNVHMVDEILKECQALALDVLDPRPDAIGRRNLPP